VKKLGIMAHEFSVQGVSIVDIGLF